MCLVCVSRLREIVFLGLSNIFACTHIGLLSILLCFRGLLGCWNLYFVIWVFAENNKELFLDYAVTYLSQVTDIGILFTGGFKDELIELLMKFDFEKAMELYESDNRKSLNSQIGMTPKN